MRVMVTIDIQIGLSQPHAFWGGAHNNPDFAQNTGALVAAARRAAIPILHVRHNSTHPGSPLQKGTPEHEFQPQIAPIPGERVFEKTVNSAFIGTGLEAVLHQMGASQLIMFGLTTDHCLSTSVRMAANLGFTVTLVGDACAAHPKVGPAKVSSAKVGLDAAVIDADTVHTVHLASLHGEFADVVTTQEALNALA